MSHKAVTLAPGVDIDLGDGLAISAENEALVAEVIDRIAAEPFRVDGFSGADAVWADVETLMTSGADSLLVIENIDQLNTMPLHPEFPSLLKIREALSELSRLRHPVVVTATEPTVDMIPPELRIGTHAAFEVMAPRFPYALGMEYSAASLDAINQLGPLGEGEAYVRIGDAAPIKARVLP
ncbi:hypothetical protein DKM27_18510 [Mycobacterium tuberculosis variant bovis]|nr:hypothetical protein DKM27_18510 [Mycobacterium tuberculosis variant bovis]